VKKLLLVLALIAAVLGMLALNGCGFVGTRPISPDDPPGFFMGLWHGMLAPWTLILRLFMDIRMYATPNSGWFYDFGYWIGITGSLPFGWLAALIAVITHIALHA
jgi:hypothetical protein